MSKTHVHIVMKPGADISPLIYSLNEQDKRPETMSISMCDDYSSLQSSRFDGIYRSALCDYVLFSDQDIEYAPNFIEYCQSKLDDYPQISYVYTDFYMKGYTPSGMDLHKAKYFDEAALKKANYISMMSVIRRSSLMKLLDAGINPFPPKLKRLQDWHLWLSFASIGCIGMYARGAPGFTAYYQRGSISNRGKTDYQEAYKKVMELNHGYINA